MTNVKRTASRLLFIISSVFLARNADATNYYVSNSGNNSNNGTSPSTPWATFANVNTLTFSAGDNLYLACGSTWNEGLSVQGSGSSGSPINITSYGSGSAPVISLSNEDTDVCLAVTNGSYWTISGLELSDANVGILFYYSSGTFGSSGIVIKNNYLHNIDVDGQDTFSSGISFAGDGSDLPDSSQWTCNGITIINNYFYEAFVPIEMNQTAANEDYGSGESNPYCWQNIEIANNSINNCGFQTSLWGVTNALFLAMCSIPLAVTMARNTMAERPAYSMNSPKTSLMPTIGAIRSRTADRATRPCSTKKASTTERVLFQFHRQHRRRGYRALESDIRRP